MSKRIRYVSQRTDTNNTLVSQRIFKAGEVEYRVFLYPLDGRYEVKNAVSEEVVLSGPGSSENVLKIRAKKALTTLGVTFDAEERVRNSESEA